MSAFGAPAIEAYLRDVAAALSGPSALRADLVEEIRAGLLDASDAYREGGDDADVAALRAVQECGPAVDLAIGLQESLIRRTSRRLSLTGLGLPAVMAGWSLCWADAAPAGPAGGTTAVAGVLSVALDTFAVVVMLGSVVAAVLLRGRWVVGSRAAGWHRILLRTQLGAITAFLAMVGLLTAQNHDQVFATMGRGFPLLVSGATVLTVGGLVWASVASARTMRPRWRRPA